MKNKNKQNGKRSNNLIVNARNNTDTPRSRRKSNLVNRDAPPAYSQLPRRITGGGRKVAPPPAYSQTSTHSTPELSEQNSQILAHIHQFHTRPGQTERCWETPHTPCNVKSTVTTQLLTALALPQPDPPLGLLLLIVVTLLTLMHLVLLPVLLASQEP